MTEKFRNPEKGDQPSDPEKRNTLVKLGIGALVAAIGASVAKCETGKSPGPEGCETQSEGCEGCTTRRFRRKSHSHAEGCSPRYSVRYRSYPSYRRRKRWNSRLEKPEGCGVMWCEGPEGC